MAYYVTTPIYYVNAAPHLGHAYTTIAADVLARHMRQRGEEVFFLTGTDEHGEPVAQAADAEGVTPQELADRNAERFRALMPILNVSNDYFIRTSDPEHHARVQEILQRVYDAGYVYEGTYEGWYCPRCADFKGEAEMLPGHRCPIHEIELTREAQENWFFALSRFQEPLERLYAERPEWVLPRARANEARAFIASGLQDVSLTRPALRWGVTVPWDPEQVFYVWFDALLNYVTALGFAQPGSDLSETFWPASVQIIGKDILKFHTVYWPALLFAAGLEVPQRMFVHGFLLGGDGRKMSKSLGNVLDPFAVIDRYGTDALRFYLSREVTFGSDGPVSDETVDTRYHAELVNELGNLASRTLAMVDRYRAGRVPAAALDSALAEDLDPLAPRVCELLDGCELSIALDEIWQRVRRLNRYVEERAPWAQAKDPARAGELNTTLATLVEGLRIVAVVLHPYMPAATRSLLDALGERAPEDLALSAARCASSDGGGRLAERALAPLAQLFPRLR
ncbi:MAG: methionine--tRNA ligase [Solirubrobacteraceae bacterium]|nr:MAG: methionine--tRNA ligase [Solirubrobacterales bacterium]